MFPAGSQVSGSRFSITNSSLTVKSKECADIFGESGPEKTGFRINELGIYPGFTADADSPEPTSDSSLGVARSLFGTAERVCF
jgi:hypothetical protein